MNIDDADLTRMKGLIRSICVNLPRHGRKSRHAKKPNRIYIACDASDGKGAAALLNKHGNRNRILFEKEWSEEESSRSINWKETKTIICAVKFLLEQDLIPNDTLVVVAEDNMKAKTAVNNCYYGNEPDLCGELLELLFFVGGQRNLGDSEIWGQRNLDDQHEGPASRRAI